jgi:hypothetical protein
MLEVKELQPLIIQWAKEKKINNPDNQFLKTLEEVGETAKAILQNDRAEILDGIGDIGVCIIIYNDILRNAPTLNLNFSNIDTNHRVKSSFIDVLLSLNFGYDDVLIELDSIAKEHDTSLKECLNIAWNVIKKRTGKTVNGTFIKNQ